MSSMPVAKLVVTSVLDPGPWRLALAVYLVAALTASTLVWRMNRRGAGEHPWPDVAVGWWLWHWFTGGPLEPHVAFADFDVHRARYIAHRALVGAARTALAGALVLAEYFRSGGGAGPVAVAVVVGPGALVAGALVWAIFFAAVQVGHYRRWVRPLHLALHQLAGWPEGKWPHTWLTVPRDRAEGRDGVIVKLPPNFDVREKSVEKVVEVVQTRLDLGDVKVTPVLHRRHGYVRFHPRDRIPERAMFADAHIRQLVEDARATAPIMGVTVGGAPVAIDLDTESPHVLVSAGTGGGKSSLTRTLVAQLMCHGANVTVIDIKRRSHQWLRPLPGVTYARDIGEIHHALLDMAAEGHRRNRLWDEIDIDEPGPVFTRHVLLCEELNATMGELRDWWKDHREPGQPAVSPAIRALGKILFMGRESRIHVLAVAQMATANDMGGTEKREQYFCRVLARYNRAAAKMLAPDCNLPPATRHPGRVQVCIAGVATETQAVYMTLHEARGLVAEHRGAVIDVARARPLGERPATVAVATSTDGATPLTLKELSADQGMGVVDLNLRALQRGLQRDPEAPAPVGRRGTADLYSPTAVQRWETNRPMAGGRQAPDDGRNEVDGVDRNGTRDEG